MCNVVSTATCRHHHTALGSQPSYGNKFARRQHFKFSWKSIYCRQARVVRSYFSCQSYWWRGGQWMTPTFGNQPRQRCIFSPRCFFAHSSRIRQQRTKEIWDYVASKMVAMTVVCRISVLQQFLIIADTNTCKPNFTSITVEGKTETLLEFWRFNF